MQTLPAFIREQLAEPRPNAFLERVEGAWRSLSSDDALQRIADLAAALREVRNLQAGDRVAIIAENSVDWLIADFAILSAGLVVVPVFATQALDQVAFILNHSAAKLVFVGRPAVAERLQHEIASIPPVVVLDGDGADSLRELERAGRERRQSGGIDTQAYAASLDPKAMAVLIYTSGTTGDPKGVMLSHHNVVSNVTSSFGNAFDSVKRGEAVLSVLPFSHIYEHHIAYGYLLSHVDFHICHHADQLLADLQSVRPVAMTAVPRIFERVLAGTVGKAKREGGLKAKLVPWALHAGRDYMRAKLFGPPPSLALRSQYLLAHALVLRKLRPLLGLDRLRFFCSGSAPLHLDVALTFAAADITILEGYGPTECSPVISVNRLDSNRYGTVGKPLPDVELRLEPDGEICVRGPNVMLGYYQDPDATGVAIPDGWYHTGDIGEFDADGYLKITDRKKEVFKTSQGKFIAPSRVEASLKRSIYLNQAIVTGNGRPYPAALVAPNWELVTKELGIPNGIPTEELARRADVRTFVESEVRAHTADLAKFEQIRRVAILPRDLTIEDGELSPTLKVRRRVVEARYAGLIEEAYRGAATPV